MSNLTLQDFQDNFVTHIRTVEREHTDLEGVFDYGVGFNVVCKPNNRVMFFESHIGSNQLPPNPNDDDLVGVAWSNLLPEIKSWATGAFSSPSLIGSVYVPASNLPFASSNVNITLDDFTSNYTTKVSRFGVYPETQPNSWCVGFDVNKNNDSNEVQYYDTNVYVTTFAIQKAENEILDLGWSNLRDKIGLWATKKSTESTVLNTEYSTFSW